MVVLKSVKPGRGPSFLGGVGSVGAVIFGIIWTIVAASMGAPALFPLFGVVFIIIGIVQAVYHFKNATSENRYSAFDITDENEEPDPLNERFGNHRSAEPRDLHKPNESPEQEDAGNFCPYCGAPVHSDYEFCRKCGRNLK
jgi:hypothetical protein